MRLFLIFFMAIFTMQAQAQSIFERLTPPLVGAHRGGFFGSIPNNTLERFEQSIEENAADILEMDMQLTKDGVLVVHHDETLQGNTNCRGKIIEKNYAEIQNCKIKGKYSIPTFESVLKMVAGRKIIDAEFKTNDVIEPAVRLVKANNAYDWVFFQTKSEPEKYQKARSLDAKVALLFKPDSEEKFNWWMSLDDPYLVVIEMHKDFITPERVQKVHAKGKVALVDTWRYQRLEERFSASCDAGFELGIDIGVTNNEVSCAKQKSAYQRP